MKKAIIDYQKAFKEITDGLKENNNIISIFVFGSMVTGDLWEGSDIDLFVICKDEFNKVRDVYSDILDIPVHTKFLSKNSFMDLYNSIGKEGTIKNTILSSKMIYCVDKDIELIYSNVKYSILKDKEKWNLVYLGQLYKDIRICKKYLHSGGTYTSYEVLIRALDSFSKLYLNMNGYTVSKDSLSMACNFNDSLDFKVNNLLSNKVTVETIKNTISYIEEFLEYNLIDAVDPLIKYLKEKNEALSSFEIRKSDEFKAFNIKLQDILKVLYKKGIILKDSRSFNDSYGNMITYENVYLYKS
ncbi:nucleotidyltransferase domain-containing protein [Clostridium sp.]|uniref:nucleotidyltransferase domain-containing protein n=1 Tax=Clostridium sp. TaxID=1506 RepID=UPI003F3FCE98